MKPTHFLKSKLFLIQLGIALIITIVLIWITLLNLRLYTHHGEEIIVPDLYGMSLEDAGKKVKSENFRYSIFDSIYNPKFKAGTVLDQRPLPGAVVKENRNLFLTINSMKPEQVRFPNLVDNSFRQAYELLVSSGFKIGKLEYIENQFFNLVLYPKYNGETIQEGSMIDKGATIDLVLGLGDNDQINAPNLIGKNQAQAKEKIILSNMNLGRIIFDESIQNHFDSLQAKVWKQYPSIEDEQKIRPGTNIDIWLTRDSVRLHRSDSLLHDQIGNLIY